MPRKGKRPAHRPVTIKLDYDRIEGLARIHCTDEEIATVEGISLSYFRQKKKSDERLTAALEKGRAIGKMSLRRKQWEVAENKEHPKQTTMLVWLGKQLLGQREKVGMDVSTYEAQVEEMSRKLAEVVGAAEALTPEQKQALLDEVAEAWSPEKA